MTPIAANFANALAFIKFYSQAVNRYDLHSPFLSDWYDEVYADRRNYYAFNTAEQVRRYWIKKGQAISSSNIGAPSRVNKTQVRTTTELARYGSVSRANGRFLFRMCQWLKPKSILEFGTNLGISTIYLRAGAPKANIISMEGNPQLVQCAQESFSLSHARGIQLRPGLFSDTLDQSLSSFDQLDFVFMDGDHRGEATQSYVQKCLTKMGPGSCIIIDDIHWSEDMSKAWHQIRHNGHFDLSLDLFQMGVLFIKPAIKEPIHLSIVPTRWKPWRMGFFAFIMFALQAMELTI